MNTMWWIFTGYLLIIAGYLLAHMTHVERQGLMSRNHYTRLCLTGSVSAGLQVILLWFTIPASNTILASMFLLTGLGCIAGMLVLARLSAGRLTDQTATALLFVGHVVYPAFLMVFMLWSWDIAS